MEAHLSGILGHHEFKHPTSRLTGLPPEVSDTAVANTLSRYGDITSITEKVWTSKYRYKVSTGAPYVNINLKAHIPSQVTIAGYKTLAQYDGQNITSFICQECGHTTTNCPHKRTANPRITNNSSPGQEGTWANIVRHGKPQTSQRPPADPAIFECTSPSNDHTHAPILPIHIPRETDVMLPTHASQHSSTSASFQPQISPEPTQSYAVTEDNKSQTTQKDTETSETPLQTNSQYYNGTNDFHRYTTMTTTTVTGAGIETTTLQLKTWTSPTARP
jgi:hypothetical protein